MYAVSRDMTDRQGNDIFLPFALLTFTDGPIARRAAGDTIHTGQFTIAQGQPSASCALPAGHAAALAQACAWLGRALDGQYPLTVLRGHRTAVEVDGPGVAIDDSSFTDESSPVLALAWVAALLVARGTAPKAALATVASLYGALPSSEQDAIQRVLENAPFDAGHLCALFLSRTARETAPEEQERWQSWFIGQREIDLPYDRRAVIDILESDIDPDEKRLLLHDTVRKFDYATEAANIARVAANVRASGQELVFGRMSRAFHNQGLLLANAGYVQIDAALRESVAALASACAGSPRLVPAADRLRILVQGAAEAALTGTLGALELLENAILDDQRQRIDEILKAEREGRPTRGGETRSDILARADQLLARCRDLRDAFIAAPQRPAAYVIMSQRVSATGSHLFARINESQEPYLGKAENLKMLVRKGGSRMYASPEYAWLHHADHWVEAIPLFIKERVLVVDGAEITETVIDQQTMEESFREQLADHWAINIDNVTDSEHVTLARELLAAQEGSPTPDAIGALAARIAAGYRAHAEDIHLRAEREHLSRYDALRTWLNENTSSLPEHVQEEAARLTAIAHLPRRPLPALHVLTTQSARMSDGYIRTWIEESMALFNVIRAHGLEGEVKQAMSGYRRTISAIGARLIRELGMWTEVEEVMAQENLSEDRAVMRIIAGNAAISRQVSIIAVLAEHTGTSAETDIPLVEDLLATQADALRAQAIEAVYERNDLELLPHIDAYRRTHPEASEAEAAHALIVNNADYADDLIAFTRFAAREEAIRELDRQDAALCLGARVSEWMRNHTRLALTTARREVLLAHGLNHLTLHPLYYYRAAGGNKRFHQLYTPSRVDLGSRERESVETWAQWVGGADREAARVGRRVYGLINKNVKMFDSLTEPEVLKTGENASMVSHFSYANAMSLLINSAGRGDIEELGDQMSLRKDRFIHPGGEGYGGYCVPKDGLFLEFVLILTRATKLRQLGVPDHLHAGIVAFSRLLIEKRETFDTELEWEAWAMAQVSGREELDGLFSLRDGANGPVPVFQITRIAQALTRLGRPELTNSFDVLANLAARWGIHKIIVGGEQVNRFMPFYKSWLTYQAVADARRLNPDVPVKDDFTVILSAEYKPDTQDGRYSVGMRKYEIFAGTGEHLTYSLDVPGQDLVHLMFHGFTDLWQNRTDPRLRARLSRLLQEMHIREDDHASINRLHEMFPGYRPPAEIRMVSPMGLATSDLLHYVGDTNIEGIALEVQRRLLNAGLTESDITANMQVYGPRLERWTKLRDLPAETLDALIARIGGDIHALALRIIGPAGNYEIAIQGSDVLDTGIPHRDLLALLANPVKVRDLMLEGNPHSALVIIDGASGARHRALNKLAVMRWFAAGDAIARQTVYRCVGIGAETIESWRAEMRHQRDRAQSFYAALQAGDLVAAQDEYQDILTDLADNQESALFLEDEERMMRFKKETPQETAVARGLTAIAAGLPLGQLDFATWLALGGHYCVMGLSPARFAEMRAAFARAIATVSGTTPVADDATVSALFCPAYVPAVEEFSEEKGIESSNKATEEVAAVAIDTRKRLAERAARAKALHDREQAFLAAMDEQATSALTLEQILALARETRGDGAGITQAQFGRLQALTRTAFRLLGEALFADAPEHRDLLDEHLAALFTGRELDPLAMRAISGGYENPGDIARLAQSTAEALREGTIDETERDRRLAAVAAVAELYDCCRAITLTIDFFTVESTPQQVWKALAEFYAESINDHFYEYRPWAYSRGIGFSHLSGEPLYELAVAHHQWQYRYLRTVILTYTELQDWKPALVNDLLGDMATADAHPAIGADGESTAERRWRAYTQLREIAFIRNDGFPLPQVFPTFDPQLIAAARRGNMIFLYPVGRTHVSRALMEGPTLAAELAAAGKPGVNLLITRDVEIVENAQFSRPVLQAHNAHLYINRDEYIAALVRHRGLSQADAETLAAQHVGPKGVRIAARFSEPILLGMVFPFHGQPKYASGRLEELGLPYSSQSLFHTWTTYDKAKYPEIFAPETGVDIPGEMDWLASYTAQMNEADVYQALEFGDASKHFPGLRAFAKRYPIVMVKDAAESGGRGQKAFTLRRSDNSLDDAAIAGAAEFIYTISLKHNVAIQEVIISSPEYWATEAFMQSFVDRQVQEWGAVVNRERRPRTSLYGSHRLIFSSANPLSGEWHISHPITLNSRQLITNVGRGGTLDLFRPEIIRAEFRELLCRRMQEAGEKCMNALARFGDLAADQYTQESGRAIGQDATGLSYAVPRYMMLDFLVQPIFAEEGMLVDLEPVYDQAGNRCGTEFILQQGDERRKGTVKDWRVVLIEPNIGIGLWDRLAIREEYYFARTAQQPDWHAVGANARIVLRDFAQASEDYLQSVGK